MQNFPKPGTQPDLTFYYNLKWQNIVTLAKNGDNETGFQNFPIVLNEGDNPLISPIGKLIGRRNIINGNYYISNISVVFTREAGGGSIDFEVSKPVYPGEPILQDNSTYVFKIVDGSGDYTFANGFVVYKTDDKGGRFVYVYFFKC